MTRKETQDRPGAAAPAQAPNLTEIIYHPEFKNWLREQFTDSQMIYATTSIWGTMCAMGADGNKEAKIDVEALARCALVPGPNDQYITPKARAAMAREIALHENVEVFFIGRTNCRGVITRVEAFAYGHQSAVPADYLRGKFGDVMLHNHPSGNLRPSALDIDAAGSASMHGIGSYIVNNAVTELRVVVKPYLKGRHPEERTLAGRGAAIAAEDLPKSLSVTEEEACLILIRRRELAAAAERSK